MQKTQIIINGYIDDMRFIEKKKTEYRKKGYYASELIKDMVQAYKEKFEKEKNNEQV